MKNEINKLILSIKDSLKEYTEGNISFEEARDEYLKLLNRYNILEKKNRSHEGLNILQGLCYYHNSENYSIFTAVYQINTMDITPIAYYGDNKLNSKTIHVLQENIFKIMGEDILTIPPNNSILHHSTHIYPLTSEKKNKIIFINLSSSIYYSNEKFIIIGELLNKLLSNTSIIASPITFNYFETVTSDIDSYCRKNVNDEYYITAELFIFNNIVNIFNHLGILSLLESSEMIIDTLKKNSAQDSRCYALSLKEYIVLSKLMKGDKTHNQKNKNIEFLYQDISIPFATITFKIDTENSIYNLWEKVFVFEEYISSGDIK